MPAYLTAVVGLPLLVGVLCVGAGLLVDRCSGGWLPLLLLAPIGFAALVGVAQVFTTWSVSAPVTPVAFIAVAAAGYAVGARRLKQARQALRGRPWPLLAAGATYVVAIAPVLFAGRATLPGYLLDSTVGVQLAGADALLSHGRDFAGLGDSSYGLYLQAYFGLQYPSGAHLPMGVAGRLLPVDLMWLYQPYLASLLALCTPSLWVLLRRFGVPLRVTLVASVVAALPALVYAYGLMGAIKEIGVLPLIVLLFAVVVLADRWVGKRPYAVIPLGVVAGAGLSTIGLAFAAWLGVAAAILLAGAAWRLRRGSLQLRPLAWQIALVAVVTVVAALQTTKDLASSITLATGLSESNAVAANDPGNLLQPLHWQQVFGVWLQGTHRVDPTAHVSATWALVAIVGVTALFGIASLVRGRQWTAIAFIGGSGAIWWLLTQRGTTWTDAKLIVLSSPLALLLAFVGIGGLAAAARRPEAMVLTVLVAVGVLWSDALLYHDTNLAPTDRFAEQQRIASRFDGDGPALLTDFDEYALYELRDLAPSSPGLALEPGVLSTYGNGAAVPYGATVDLDQMALSAIKVFPLLIERRSPERSLPPTGYELAYSGDFYRVWRRTPEVDRVQEHVALPAAGQATPAVACKTVRKIVRGLSDDAHQLVVASRPTLITRTPERSTLTGAWAENPAGGMSVFGPARMRTGLRAPRTGRYRIYLKGDINRPFTIAIDGKRVGAVSYQTGGQGHVSAPLTVELSNGPHSLTLTRGGGSLSPGNGGPARLEAVYVEPAWAGAEPTRSTLPVSQWRSLCGQRLDWIEVVASSARD